MFQTAGIALQPDRGLRRAFALVQRDTVGKMLEIDGIAARAGADAKEQHDRWKPDSLIIEKKASGEPLIQELRRMGIYIYEVDAHRSADKVTRVHSVADMFMSGAIWAPRGFR